MATNLATAYVAVVPSMEGVQGQLMRQLVPAAGRAGDAAGADAGKRMGGRFSTAMKGAAVGAVAGIGAMFAGQAIVGQMKEVIREAGNLQQSAGAVNSVFKEGAPQVASWARGAAKSFGLSADEYNGAASLLGSQLKNAGVSMDELGPKTNNLIGLGADLASMFGGDTKSAVEAVSSALKGERDPIEKYGVSLRQSTIDAKAAALGFEKVDGALSAEANAAATMALIMEQTTDAHGNFAREAGTYQGAVARMSAQWDNLQARMGEMFLPVLSRVVGWLSDRLLPTVETVLGGVRAFGMAFGAAKDGMIDITSTGFAGWMENIGNRVGTFYMRVDQWVGALVAGFNLSGPMIERLGDKMHPVVRAGVTLRTMYEGVAGVVREHVAPVLERLGRYLVENRNGLYALGIVVGAGAVAFKVASAAQAAYLAVTVGIPKAVAAARAGVIALNAAMHANVFALVVAAIVAFIAGLVLAYNRVGWFRDFVDRAWSGIRAAVSGVVSWWTSQAVPALRAGFDTVGRVARWLYENVMRPAWTGIRTAVAVSIAVVTTVLQGVSWLVRNTVGRVFLWLYDSIIRPVFDRVTTRIGGFRAWWSGVAVPAVRAGLDLLGRVFRALFDAVVRPIFDRITARIAQFRSWWDGTAATVRAILDRLGRGFRSLYDAHVRPVWDNISRKIGDVYGAIRSRVFEPLSDWVRNKLGAAFGRGVDAISRAWDRVKRIASAPVDFVINRVLNDGFIANFNKIAKKFGIGTLPTVSFKGLHDGGIVPGRDPGRRDNVLMPMRSGEGVLIPEAVAMLGGRKWVEQTNARARGAAAPAGAQFAPGDAVYGGPRSFSGGLQQAVYRSGVMNVAGSAPGYDMTGAINMVDRATRVKVKRGNARPNVHVGLINSPEWWGGYYLGGENDTIRLNTRNTGNMGMAQKRILLAHEIGHALGLPHSARMHGGNGVHSMMNYDNMYQTNSVTAADVAALSRIYGGSGFASGGGPVGEDDKPGMIQRLIDRLLKTIGFDGLKNGIPGAGFMLDLMKKSADVVFSGFKSWVRKKLDDLNPAKLIGIGDGEGWLGKTAAKTPGATVFDGGGWLEQSAAPVLAWHRQRKPDAVLSNDQWRDIHSLARKGGDGGPRTNIENLNAFDMTDALRQIAFEDHVREVLFNV